MGARANTVLVLCTGNYYRSCYAEALVERLTREQRAGAASVRRPPAAGGS